MSEVFNLEVMIEGTKYVPENNLVSIDVVKSILKGQKYLSESAINDIMDAFKAIRPVKSETKKPKKSSKSKSKTRKNNVLKPFEYNSVNKVLFKISGVLSNGSVLYKTRKSPSRWNIQQAIMIRKAMKNDSTTGMIYKDAIAIAKKVHLSDQMTRKIMYNIEHGDLIKYIDEWEVKYNQKKIDGPKPIQNNPQKRRESGALYV